MTSGTDITSCSPREGQRGVRGMDSLGRLHAISRPGEAIDHLESDLAEVKAERDAALAAQVAAEAERDGLRHVLAALDHHDHGYLREKVTVLKQSDGEGWAVGEMLERALAVLEGRG